MTDLGLQVSVGFGRLRLDARRGGGTANADADGGQNGKPEPGESKEYYDSISGGDVDPDGIAPNGPLSGVIRSKGIVWLANAHACQIIWHSAGRQWNMDPGQPWEVSKPALPPVTLNAS